MSQEKLDQLRGLLNAGIIDQQAFDAGVKRIAELSGSGAIAQGQGATAVGAGGVGARDNYGNINTGVIIQQGIQPGASKDDLRRAYLARILRQADQLPLFAGDTANAQIRLSSVYTALLTQRSGIEITARRSVLQDLRDREFKLSVVEALNVERKLVLMGGPGSGKSTFVSFVALSMAGELLGLDGANLATLTAPLPKDEREREDPKVQEWKHGALLPVHIVLRDLATQLGQGPGTAAAVWGFICNRLKQAALEEFAPHLHTELLDRGGLVLFDGLDEVPDANNRRVQIKNAVQDFTATFSKCRFLVTSRTYAYQRQDWKLDGFVDVHLQSFTPGQINRFVDAWYGHMAELDRLTKAGAKDRAELLKRTVERNERIRELAERPLLLTLIAQLQTDRGGTLPEKREELYDKSVEMLLNQWENMKARVRDDGTKEIELSLAEWLNAGRDDIRKQLNRLAFEAHRDQLELTGTADIDESKLVTALLRASRNHDSRADVGRLVDYLRDRAGILAAHGLEKYQFPHRSFQEYLAACHLTDDDFPNQITELARHDPNRWREVVLLAGAKATRGSALNAWALSETLCVALPPKEAIPEADHWGALLAGRVIVECADLNNVAKRDVEKLDRIRTWQLTIMRRNTLPAIERALAGRTLAALDDPRPEVMTLDGMHFCWVPPGPFVMGDDQGADDAKPQHTVKLNYPCFMARFPVTVAQWRKYLKKSGDKAEDEDRLIKGRANDPVIGVSWHEALRFCDFLTQSWQALLPEGWIVTLPSEVEWEKAARGGNRIPADRQWLTMPQVKGALATPSTFKDMPNLFPSRAYPWGNIFDGDKANTESAVGETSAVGCYPIGHSPYGCEEMSGNVWEWTRSLWGTDHRKSAFLYPYDPKDRECEDFNASNEVLRVVRGGSWSGSRFGASCACRYRNWPINRVDYIGFRVVLRSSPVS